VLGSVPQTHARELKCLLRDVRGLSSRPRWLFPQELGLTQQQRAAPPGDHPDQATQSLAPGQAACCDGDARRLSKSSLSRPVRVHHRTEFLYTPIPTSRIPSRPSSNCPTMSPLTRSFIGSMCCTKSAWACRMWKPAAASPAMSSRARSSSGNTRCSSGHRAPVLTSRPSMITSPRTPVRTPSESPARSCTRLTPP